MVEFPNLNKMKQDELFGFLKEIQRLIDEGFSKVPDDMQDFVEAVNDMDRAFEKAPLDSAGQDIADADALADAAWTGINAQLKVSLVHPDTRVCEAAARVWSVFGATENPIRLPYEEEYGILDRLLGQLDQLDKADRETALIEPWLEALRQRVDAFRALYTKRHQEIRIIGSTKTARQNAINASRSMIERVHARMMLMPTDELTAWCDAVTNVCRATRAKLKARQTRRDNAKAPADSEP